jgi:hypothetical protein
MRRPKVDLPELAELVIDNLASDKKSLTTCAQLSRLWVPRSRYHLFSTTVIGSSQLASFPKVIASPLCTIRLNINTLIIGDENEWYTNDILPPETWIALPLLAHLQSLTMRHLEVETSPTDGFHVLRQITALKRLTITSTRFSTEFLFFTFLSSLSSLPFLTHLSLQHSHFTTTSPDEHACLPLTLRHFNASSDSRYFSASSAFHTVLLLCKLCAQKKEEGPPTITEMTFTMWTFTYLSPRVFNTFGVLLEHLRLELSPSTPLRGLSFLHLPLPLPNDSIMQQFSTHSKSPR